MSKVQSINNQIIDADLDLSSIRRKRFRIDGDDNRILELNTSDLNLLVRLKDAYPKIKKFVDEAFSDLPETLPESDDYDFMTDEATGITIDKLRFADKSMRQLIDEIFDSNVSEICAPTGSMYDPINGKLRFEHIIDCLSTLYENEIASEMRQVTTNVRKHTDKYVK